MSHPQLDPSSPHLGSISLPDHQHQPFTFTQPVHQQQLHHPHQHSRTCSSSSSTLTPLTTSSPVSTSIPHIQESFSYQHHLPHSSIDSTIHSSRDLAERYLQSPGSQTFSPASDPSPVITTPVLGSPIHQISSAPYIDKQISGHQDRLDQHQSTPQFHQYQSQGRLRGLGIYSLNPSSDSLHSDTTVIPNYRPDLRDASTYSTSPRTPLPSVITNRPVAYNIHFPEVQQELEESSTLEQYTSNEASNTPTLAKQQEHTDEMTATLEPPTTTKPLPRPASSSGSRRGPPPPLAANTPYALYPAPENGFHMGSQPPHPPADMLPRPAHLRASADPFVGGTGYTGMTPTPSRMTFETAGLQMPEIQTQPDQMEQNQSLPALKTVVQDESVFGPLPSQPLEVVHEGLPQGHAEGPIGTPIGNGLPGSRTSYRRSFTSASTPAVSSRKSSSATDAGHGQTHGRAPSYYIQHVQPGPYGQAYYVQAPPPQYSYQPVPLREPSATSPFGDGTGGHVSLPGFNQLYIDSNGNGVRQGSQGHQLPPSGQQHPGPPSYHQLPQQRLQPMQTRHLPFPGSAGMQHAVSPNGLQPVFAPMPNYAYAHAPPRSATLIGYDVNGNPEYANPVNGMPIYVQQGVPMQEYVAYPPHAFQNGLPPPQAPSMEGQQPVVQNGMAMAPHATHHNVFAYQYAPGEDMDMDAPTPSVNGVGQHDDHEQADEIVEQEKADEPMSEPGVAEPESADEESAHPVDSAAEEWIPESFKKKKTTSAKADGKKKKKGKGGKASVKTTPTKKKGKAKKPTPTTSPFTKEPSGVTEKGDKTNKVIIKLPPLMPIEDNLVRFTSLADEKQTDTLKRECFTCGSRDPPSWRKSLLSPQRILCNRCGIYERSHKRARPLAEEARAAASAATNAKKPRGKGGKKNSAAVLTTVPASQIRGSYAHTPAGYTSGGHAIYSSYGQENDARRVSAVSGMPPGITDPAGYTSAVSTKANAKTPKKSRATAGSKGNVRQNSAGFRTFTTCAPAYGGIPRMEPYQYALAAHRSEHTGSVPLERANGKSRIGLNRSASAMPAPKGMMKEPWADPYADDDEEDEAQQA